MRPHRRPAVLAAALVVALAGGLAACGDEDSSSSTSTSGGSTPTAPSTPASTPAATTASKEQDVDAAFVRQMIPHHQGAVAMARIAERRAEHDEVKALAGQIIEAQERELTDLDGHAKRLGVDLAGPDALMGADAETLGLAMDEMGMSMQHGALDDADPFDRAFLDEMIAHHEGAVAMAQAQFTKGKDLELRELSDDIISAQQKEILDMSGWRSDWYGAAKDAKAPAGADHQGHGG